MSNHRFRNAGAGARAGSLRRAFTMVVLGWLGFSGCSGAEKRELSGRWEAELRGGAGAGEVVQARGTLSLAPAPERARPCRDEDRALCSTRVRGTHDLETTALVGYPLRDDVDGGVTEDGTVLFLIGGCCHRGEISVKGKPDGDVIRGRWRTLGPDSREGSLVLHRVPD